MTRTSRQTASIISTYASDASGVASALYELGGLTVIHDASGCNSTYNTHDEPRWYDMDSMVYISAVSEMEAILGDDSRWIQDLIETAKELSPQFIALAGSPIPMMIGTDFDALAMEVEAATGIPTFGIPTNGMHSYIWGASKAFTCLAERLVDEPQKEESLSQIGVNILGLTPLDFSIGGMDRSIGDVLMEAGFSIVSRWAMGDTMQNLRRAGEAKVNLVVSESGLAAAEALKRRFGMPYVVGLPIGRVQTDRLVETLHFSVASGECAFVPQEATHSEEIIIIGEGVQSLSLAQAFFNATGERPLVLCATEPEGEVRKLTVSARDEEELLPYLEKARAVVADPLYRPLVPGRCRFVDWPHEGFSGRIFRKEIPNLVTEEGITKILKEAKL